MKYLLSISLLLSVLSLNLSAQIESPVSWSFKAEKISENDFELKMIASIKDDWHVYAQDIPEGGPIPTNFEFETQEGVELDGAVLEKGDLKSEYSALFGMDLKYYKKKVTFAQRVKLKESTGKVAGYLTFMTCNDRQCLAPTDIDFSFNLAGETKEAPKEDTQKVVKEKDITPKETTTTEGPKIEKEAPSQAKTTPKETTKPSSANPDAFGEPENLFQNNGDIGTTDPEEKSSKILEPVKWITSIEESEGGKYLISFKAKIIEDWVVYSQFLEDEGPLPTEIIYEDSNPVKVSGPATEEGNKDSGYDKVFGVEVTKFKKELLLTQEILPGDAGKPIVGYIDYMSCNDEKCIALTYDFEINPDGSAVVPGDASNVAIIEDANRFGKPFENCGEAVSFSSLWVTFGLGFLGGLVALLTPCVFPMIPLTVSFFTKQSKTKSKGVKNALIYGLSIIVIYVSLGITLTAVFGVQIMNELSTNMYLNLTFFALFVIFALSFFGYFEITLPSSWANKTDRMADRGGLLGIFFMAFTLAIVSFSCTGPIIGTLLVESFKAEGAMIGNFNLTPPVGMLGFSTALALPFALFAAFPGWLNSLPRSGGWMVTVKVFLGFLEIALALKFLSVVDMTQHWGILKFELFMGLWTLTFLLLAMYLFGLIKFPHDPPKVKVGFWRGGIGAVSLVFAIYMAFGLFTYKSLYLLSGLAPPVHYNYFRPMDCPHGIDCYKDYDEALVEAKKENKPILIDFTGYGCVNCRKMEEFVWPRKQIISKLSNDFILVSLYVDDRTKLDEPYMSQFDGKKKRTVGNKWADFQAQYFGANSQPYYVLVSPDEQLLNIPKGYTPDAEAFDYFLQCGLDAFDQMEEQQGLNTSGGE